MWAKQKQAGFTIVELLIVIVVIAILATISIVAFNGIQQKGRNAARLAGANSVYKQLEIYTRQTGNNWASSVFCIPTEANFDSGNGGLLDCYASNTPRSENASDNANFAAAGIKFSYPNTPITIASGVKYYGIHLAYFANLSQGMNGALRPYVLLFFLEGSDQDCGPNSVTVDGPKVATDPLNSIIPARNYSYDSNITWCFYSLTHYSKI